MPSGRKPDRRVSSTRSLVLGENANPNAVSVSLPKYGVDDFGKECATVTEARTRNSDSLYVRRSLRGAPITDNGKANPCCTIVGNKIGVAVVGESSAMLPFVPTAHQLLVSSDPLGAHDEGDVGPRRSPQPQLGSLHDALVVVGP
jgi:hypothetical protein